MKWNETKRYETNSVLCYVYINFSSSLSVYLFSLFFSSLVGCSLFLCLYFILLYFFLYFNSFYFTRWWCWDSYNIELFVTYSIRIFCSLSLLPYDRRITRNKKKLYGVVLNTKKNCFWYSTIRLLLLLLYVLFRWWCWWWWCVLSVCGVCMCVSVCVCACPTACFTIQYLKYV